ncbi:MAG: HAD-IA family hydrolase [Gammaproteobacteria bacterium]
MPLRLALFDLDGTLADTAPDIARAVNLALSEIGRPPLALTTVRSLVSSGARALLRAGLDGAAPADADMERLLERLFAYYGEAPVVKTRVFSGLKPLIAELAESGIAWGVVSNKPIRLVEPIVVALGLAPAPVCVIGGDSLARKKPDPLPLLTACERASVEPGETIYVGDAEIDVLAARAAAMRVVIAGFGYAPPAAEVARWNPQPEFYVPTVAKLGRVLICRP